MIEVEKRQPKRSQETLKLGYWPLRGRAQVARLLLEYFGIPYQDVFYQNKVQWEEFKQEERQKWPLLELPYLIDGDLMITEAVPICCYIIRKAEKPNFLGKTIQDTSILNMYTWSMDNLGISLVQLCWMPGKPQRVQEVKNTFWLMNVKDRMDRLQQFVSTKIWMLGYLSLFDFSIYELVHYVITIFPKQMKDYKKLLEIERMVSGLPEIQTYESSKRAVKAYLPKMALKKSE